MKNKMAFFLISIFFFSLFGCGNSDLDMYYSISGQVRNEEGLGVSGVLITFNPQYGSVRTDSEGRWFKENLFGEVLVTPVHESYFFQPKERRVTKEENQVHFTMVRGQVMEVKAPDKIEVLYGTSPLAINFPKKVDVTLNNGETKKVGVSWTQSTPTYQEKVLGEYLFNGDLVLPENVSNPKGLKAKITVVVSPLSILGVDLVEDIHVNWNTSLEEIHLPETVIVTLNNYERVRVKVSWREDSPPYDQRSMGTFSLKGDLMLLDYMVNPNGVRAQVRLVVQKIITKVEKLPHLFLPYGTPQSELDLPKKIQVLLEDDSYKELEVVWDNGDPAYGNVVGGVFQFTGELLLPRYVMNPHTLKAQVLLTLTSYEIGGQVKENGVGLEGVTIHFSNGYSSVETDSDGYWSKEGLEGPVSIRPQKESYLFEPERKEVDGPASHLDFAALRISATVSVNVLVFGPTKIFRVTVHHVDYLDGALGYTISTPRQDFVSFGEEICRLTNEETMSLYIFDDADIHNRKVLASATLEGIDLQEAKIGLSLW